MPETIRPELDPNRFQYLNPLVFGEYNAAGDIGWTTAISQITGYYLGQKPFDDSILERSELERDILETWKENLASDLANNSAEELANLILQILVVVTKQPVEGVEPSVPIEGEPPIDVVPPEEPPEEAPPDREPFPPVVVPRQPQSPTRRDTSPEPMPEAPAPPDSGQRQPTPEQPRQPRPSAGEPPLFPQPILPVPRPAQPSQPRPAPPEPEEAPEEVTPPDESTPREDVTPGDTEPVQQAVSIEIDYDALSNAIYQALSKWWGNVVDAGIAVKVSSDEPDEVPPGDVIQEIVRQVDEFRTAGKVVMDSEPVQPEPDNPQIFTIPGGN